MFELYGVNYEEVLEQGYSILVRVIASSSYRGFELSGLYCIWKNNSGHSLKVPSANHCGERANRSSASSVTKMNILLTSPTPLSYNKNRAHVAVT